MTSSVLPILMAIVMAFSAIGGLSTGAEEPRSFEMKLNLDGKNLAALMPEEETPAGETAAESTGEAGAAETEQQAALTPEKKKELAAALVNALTIRGLTDGQTTELEILAGETTVLTIGLRNDGENLILSSSLLGKNVLTFKPETIQQYMQMALSGGSAGGEFKSVFEGENVKTLAAEDVLDPENQMASLQLTMMLAGGLMGTITKLAGAMPEEVSAWISEMAAEMMKP